MRNLYKKNKIYGQYKIKVNMLGGLPVEMITMLGSSLLGIGEYMDKASKQTR